jgi:hypothetical protein
VFSLLFGHSASLERRIDLAILERESIEKDRKRRIAVIREMDREFLKLDVVFVFGRYLNLNKDLCASIGLCRISPLMAMFAVLETQ